MLVGSTSSQTHGAFAPYLGLRIKLVFWRDEIARTFLVFPQRPGGVAALDVSEARHVDIEPGGQVIAVFAGRKLANVGSFGNQCCHQHWPRRHTCPAVPSLKTFDEAGQSSAFSPRRLFTQATD